MEKSKELIKALALSIDMEERGREFYIKAAGKSSNEFTKRVFEGLADDETRHITAIKGYRASMEKKNAAPRLRTVMPRHKAIKERVIFGRRESELLAKIKPGVDELKAYETAMKMENDGYNFYKKTLESATDPNVKELYKFLLKEEETHFELLSSTHEYLKNPEAWFAGEEKPIVEG